MAPLYIVFVMLVMGLIISLVVNLALYQEKLQADHMIDELKHLVDVMKRDTAQEVANCIIEKLREKLDALKWLEERGG